MAHIRKREGKTGRSYQVRWVDPDGQERAKTFSRKGPADVFLRKVEREMDTGEYVDPSRGDTPYATWVEDGWWPGYAPTLGDSTRIRYRGILDNYLLPRFGDTKLSRLRQEDIQAWVGDLTEEDGLAPATVKKNYDLLQRSVEAAVAADRLQRSPCKGIHLPRQDSQEMRALTTSQVDALATTIAPLYRAMVLVAAYGGLRLGELAGLKVDRVDLLHGQVQVVETLSWPKGKPTPKPVPKSDAGRRMVGLPGSVVEALDLHLSSYPASDEGYIFTSVEGLPLRKDNYRRRHWNPTTEAVGLPALKFHELRHTAASLMIRAGADVLTLARRLGHAKPSYTLDLYGHWYPDQDQALRSNLDAMIESGSVEASNVANMNG